MISSPLGVFLSMAAPLFALSLAMRAFRRRTWPSYRAFARASCVSALFGILVVAYVVLLGTGAPRQGLARIHMAMGYGILPMFTLATALDTGVVSRALMESRTDTGRPVEPGRPMLVVFAVLLTVLLTVVLVCVQLSNGKA